MITDEKQMKLDSSTLGLLLELAAKEVFEMMVDSRLERSEANPLPDLDTTAMIGLAGSICGVISVKCDSETAAAIASKMLGLPVSPSDPSAHDGIAEVVNMIAGNFKSKLNGADRCMLSIPTVITGADYQMRSLAVSENFKLLMEFASRPLTVTMELHG